MKNTLKAYSQKRNFKITPEPPLRLHRKVKTRKAEKWPGFIPPQLAYLVNVPPETKEWVHEIKFDGYRLQTHIKNSKVKMFTRGAHDWSERFSTITNAFIKLDVESAIFDGEVVVIDELGRSNFSELQSALSQKKYSNMRIYLFDLLYLNGEDLRRHPLKERKALLKDVLSKSVAPIFYSEDVKENAIHFLKLCCDYKLEGIISKDLNAPYISGRSKTWCKTKCSARQEFIICGYTEEKTGNAKGIGALLLGVNETNHGKKRKIRYVGKVGTGFDTQMLLQLKHQVSLLEQKKSPFGTDTPRERGIHWIKPHLVAEVRFSNWTSDWLLRQPVFLGLRSDKDSKKIILEKSKHETKKVSVFTHPQKIFFPADKITKQMIADYYEKVAHLILPHVKGRPLSMVRCPDRGKKKCFYHKHPGKSSTLKNLKSFSVKEKGDTKQYVTLTSAEELRGLVQMNVFEIHTWNSHYQTLLYPDQLVLDFDPDLDVSFKTVVRACLEMKKMLDKLNLKSFVKVTGGKGIHIHIPLEPIYTWDQAKAFSKALADVMVLKNPKQFIATSSKKARKGKIFIDYLRNGYGATAIAPYSLRAKDKSAVALPVSWNELSKLKSSDQFTLKKALLKIKNRKTDPWKEIRNSKQKIAILK